MTKNCDFPYPIYDLIKTLVPIYDLTLTVNIICVGLLLLVLSSVRSRRLTGERKAKRGCKEGGMIKK